LRRFIIEFYSLSGKRLGEVYPEVFNIADKVFKLKSDLNIPVWYVGCACGKSYVCIHGYAHIFIESDKVLEHLKGFHSFREFNKMKLTEKIAFYEVLLYSAYESSKIVISNNYAIALIADLKVTRSLDDTIKGMLLRDGKVPEELWVPTEAPDVIYLQKGEYLETVFTRNGRFSSCQFPKSVENLLPLQRQ